jgi:predicted metal-binding transcription factor (methanogenesis marker protein 9)
MKSNYIPDTSKVCKGEEVKSLVCVCVCVCVCDIMENIETLKIVK